MRALIATVVAGARSASTRATSPFASAPRINAAGRLYRADAGVELMLTADQARADEIAAELDRANHERRAVEREVLDAAEASRRELPAGARRGAGLVLAGEGLAPGRRRDRRLAAGRAPPPARWSLIALDADGAGRGSGRSIPGFDLLAGLRACDAHLGRYGGHRAAAGLEIEAAQRGRTSARPSPTHCAAVLDDALAGRTEVVDAVVGGESLGHDVAEQLAAAGAVRQGQPRGPAAGSGGQPRRRPADGGGRSPRPLHDRQRLEPRARGRLRRQRVAGRGERQGPIDVSLELELNEWNGAVEPRVVLGEVYPCGAGESDDAGRPAACSATQEFWRRLELELEHPTGRFAAGTRGCVRRRELRRAPPRLGDRGDRRACLQRRDGAGAVRATPSAAASWSSAPRGRRASAAASWRSSPPGWPMPRSPPPRAG